VQHFYITVEGESEMVGEFIIKCICLNYIYKFKEK